MDEFGIIVATYTTESTKGFESDEDQRSHIRI